MSVLKHVLHNILHMFHTLFNLVELNRFLLLCFSFALPGFLTKSSTGGTLQCEWADECKYAGMGDITKTIFSQ